MLKHGDYIGYGTKINPAAFRRLCVETNSDLPQSRVIIQPPSGGCVLKLNYFSYYFD